MMLKQNEHSREIGETQRHYGAHTPTVDSMISEVLHTLRSIDFRHDAELAQLENSSTDEEVKNDIRGKLIARHRERREPYVELLAELRMHSTTFLS